MPQIQQVLLQAAELNRSITRLDRLQRQEESLRNELSTASRTAEAKVERFRARAQLTDRENREAVRLLMADIPVTIHCPYCENEIKEKHLDHIVPVVRGGRPLRGNLVWVCVACNLRKRDLTLLEFADRFDLDYMAIVRRLQSLGKRP